MNNSIYNIELNGELYRELRRELNGELYWELDMELVNEI